jgi:hypothetical protein
VPVERLFEAWNDEALRKQWLPDAITIRKSTSPKSLRITWSDGTTWVDVNMYPKGEGKCSLGVEHSKLEGVEDVAARKAFWAQKLDGLKSFLEG